MSSPRYRRLAGKPRGETKMSDYEIVDPDPAALIESLRAFGYTTATAIADLVDNSITARARNVWVTFYWDGPDSWIRIDDDGTGMTEEELLAAMRPGSRSPKEPRDPKDLGRFGLGLKSASFSQCRLLTVRSRPAEGEFSVRAWDLDMVERSRQWRLQRTPRQSTEAVIAKVSQDANTSVMWEVMDRIVDESRTSERKAQELFLLLQEEVEAHLAMTFHRFMQSRSRSLKLWMNGARIEPWDPFLIGEDATQPLEVDPVWYQEKRILVQPYVLPHHSRISADTHRAASGPRGWNAHQGFYVYRNERLLLPGDWLGLGFQKEEHFKLARIQVDIPNSMDEAWNIDVKKAVARPPGALRPDLVRIAKATRERASAVYRHRGKRIARSVPGEFAMVWRQEATRDKVHYAINRDHPLVRQLLADAGALDKSLKAVLRLIEETVPTALITMNFNEGETRQAEAFEAKPQEVASILREVYRALLRDGLAPKDAVERLVKMEPFDRYPELVAALEETEGVAR